MRRGERARRRAQTAGVVREPTRSVEAFAELIESMVDCYPGSRMATACGWTRRSALAGAWRTAQWAGSAVQTLAGDFGTLKNLNPRPMSRFAA